MEGPCSSLGIDEGLLDIPRHDFEGALYSLEGLWEESVRVQTVWLEEEDRS